MKIYKYNDFAVYHAKKVSKKLNVKSWPVYYMKYNEFKLTFIVPETRLELDECNTQLTNGQYDVWALTEIN